MDKLDAATNRKVAVEAKCDPRTVEAVVKGGEVKGLARERAHNALVRLGLIPPDRKR